MSEKRSGGLGETIRTIIYAVLIALVIRTFGYEPFNIPSGSMKPTLLIGDYLFVSKFSYGYSKYSFPFSLPIFEGRVMADEPERGDVAVFRLPSDPSIDYIKRIVGLPGDRIQVAGGILHINDSPIERREVQSPVQEDPLVRSGRIKTFIETLPGGREHLIYEHSDFAGLDNTPVYTVPEGHYFLMGDNRDSSRDSRVMGEVGFVPAENLIGRADILFFSHNGSARFWEIWKWPQLIRFGRIANTIE